MRVRADQRVRIRERRGPGCLFENDAREVFEVDLVDDARVGRHDAEILERFLAPA